MFVVQAIYLGGMMENTAFDQVYHEHLCYYTLRSLEALLARHGLEVFDARLVPIHGGTIEVHVAPDGQRGGSAKACTPCGPRRSARASARSRPTGISPPTCWPCAISWWRCWKTIARHGKSVWAYGAPAKGATLLNSFGIGPDLVQKAVERNPMKVGLAIPGVRIPIAEERAEEKPDAYLVLAWNFIDEFLKNPANIAFMQGGGEFIVPIPNVKVVSARGARQV